MLPLLALMIAALPPGAAPDTAYCRDAAVFAREVQHLVAEVHPDTVDDWRTGRRLAGCRITAAGATSDAIAAEAARLFERLRASGWTRTPDPRDAPNESSLRFRRAGADCLFNVYAEARLFTEEEFRVNDAVTLRLGERRYQLLVQCIAALPAAPR
jgi:hypothetical protein